MSARPQRERKPIRTLANNQARNAAASAVARPKKPQSVGRPKPMSATVVNTARINVLPAGKGTLIPILKIVISQVTNDEDLQNLLILRIEKYY